MSLQHIAEQSTRCEEMKLDCARAWIHRDGAHGNGAYEARGVLAMELETKRTNALLELLLMRL